MITDSHRTYDATIRWTDKGTATVTAGAHVEAVRHLDGEATTVHAGDTITITEEPVLITASSAPQR